MRQAIRANPFLYRAAKRAQPLYLRVLAVEAQVWRTAARWSGFSSVLRNPQNVRTAHEMSASPTESIEHRISAEHVRSDRKARRIVPSEISTGARAIFDGVADASSGPGTVYRVKEGFVWGRDGAVLSCDRTLLSDLSPVIRTCPEAHPIFRKPLLRAPRRIDGRLAMATGPSAENLSHWMFGVLPRLALLSMIDPGLRTARIAVPATRSHFHGEFLRRYGAEQGRLVPLDGRSYLRAEEIWAPSFVNPAYVAPRWFLDDLRQRFADVAAVTGAPRLYISRSKAPGRRVRGENVLVAWLEKRGFNTVHLETLPLLEQIALFKGARVIVAAHGAGLSHLAFAAPGTKVFELFAPSYINPMYWCVADELGLEYRCYVGAGDGSTSRDLVRADIILTRADIDRLAGDL